MAIRPRKRMEHTTETREQVIDLFPFRHPLDTGDRGALVLFAQSKLAEHGTYTGPLDGRYDMEVSKAVRAFQAANGLKITGIIDRKTWDAL